MRLKRAPRYCGQRGNEWWDVKVQIADVRGPGESKLRPSAVSALAAEESE